MLTYRKYILSKIRSRNEIGANTNTQLLKKAVFDAIDVRAEGEDPTAKHFQSELKLKAMRISHPEDYTAWDDLFDVYSEALVYLVARERKVWLEHIPTKDTPTPDFLGKSDVLKSWFEVKTLNLRGGVHVQDEITTEGLSANLDAEAEAAKSGVGIGIHEVAPHGHGATALDAVRQTIDKINNNVKRGQYTETPSYLIVGLDRLGLSTSKESIRQIYEDRFGDTTSGHLHAVALGRPDDQFYFRDPNLIQQNPVALDREGILHTHNFIDGIIFLSAVWQDLAEFDGAFRHQAYRLYGFRRESTNETMHGVFDSLCDIVTKV